VRSTSLLGMMILMLGLMISARGAAEQGQEEGAAQTGQPFLKTSQRQLRTVAPPRAPKESKARRRPALPLELPAEIEEETAEGISLDDALQRLLAANRDLAVKYHEIPKARADTLSARLIENPAIFLDSEGIPYGNYSRQRPGQTSYGPTVIFPPLDYSGKRRKRLTVARRAEKVLEALYQDAVRQEIDKLYSAYIDVLEATVKRNALRRASARLNALVESRPAGADPKAQPAGQAAESASRRAYTEIALREAEASLLQARRELAVLLALPPEQADNLPVRGSLRDQAPPPPGTDELVPLALQTRPDLNAFQLSVERAQANVQLNRAEAWDDALIFYTPYQASTFPSQGRQTASAWEVGGLAVLPIFERNQGDIARGRANVAQLQIQVRGLRDQIVYEVQRAASEYDLSRQLVQKYESTILPRARSLRDDKQRRSAQGQEALDAFLAAEQNYDEAVQRYLEALVNHRRSMLRLNTVVGQRILP
jgi:cobalt-zinc-cadmium efflux system outer membrane protein